VRGADVTINGIALFYRVLAMIYHIWNNYLMRLVYHCMAFNLLVSPGLHISIDRATIYIYIYI